MAKLSVVDVDDQSTWPTQVLEYVSRWATRLDDGRELYAADLPIPLEDDAEFRRLFDGHLIRAFHCTRLLPHEEADVLSRGLQLADRSLVDKRIADATHNGLLNAEESQRHLSSHFFSDPDLESHSHSRANQVCLFVSRRIFSQIGAVAGLLDTWGGEVIVSALGWDSADRDRLRKLGRPTIVVANLKLSCDDDDPHFITPRLANTFVGTFLTLPDRGSDIIYKAPVPGPHIESLWHPGDASYDQFPGLPR